MSEKLTDAITIRVSHDEHEEFRRLADVEGMGVSELMRSLMDTYKATKRRQYEALHAALGATKSNPV